MAKFELKLPKMGESVAEATITSWLKEIGDTIEADEAVFEIATDKVDSEVPSEVEGVLVEKLFEVDAIVQVGQTIAIIETSGDDRAEEVLSDTEPDKKQSEEPAEVSEIVTTITAVKEATTSTANAGTRFYSPLVRNIAKEEGVSATELENIAGSGKEGRVTKNDILAYIENRSSKVVLENPGVVKPSKTQVAPTETIVKKKEIAPIISSGDDEIIEMTRMGKLVAHHMVQSVQTSAHVQSFIEADVTNIWNWRKKVKDDFYKREGENLTFTPIFMEAVAKALRDYPMMNISLQGDTIIKKKHINLGMAAALGNGDLIVPVIKNADQLNLVGMTKKVNDLASRARDNKLKPDDIAGGTYTMTNVGSFGNVMGTPIINQPQVAIMAVGAIQKKPAVVETPNGDAIAIRHKMFLSHAYDHRVVDGALGGMFVRRVADYLENFDVNREL